MMRVDPSFDGTFKMFLDPSQTYTYKSQYLDKVTLTGDKSSGIEANENDNILLGNQANNHIDGKAGTDIVQFSGPSEDYEITKEEGKVMVRDLKDRDDFDVLVDIETLRFTDKDVSLID